MINSDVVNSLHEILKQDYLNSLKIAEIKESDKWKDLTNKIKEIEHERMQLITDYYIDYSELNSLKEEVINEFLKNNIEEGYNLRLVKSVKKKVDNELVLKSLGGDIDIFLKLSEISQKNINDFAKKNKEYKGLKKCIKTISTEVKDIKLLDF